MSHLLWLVPVALGMGAAGLAAFFWSLRSGQYEDLDGAAERILLQRAEDVPITGDGWQPAGQGQPIEIAEHVGRGRR